MPEDARPPRGVAVLSADQLTGVDESHLVEVPGGHRLCPAVAGDFAALQRDAAAAGFDLRIASGFRSFERQRAIWNAKAGGVRTVHDDRGRPLDMARLAPGEQLRAILRFSALPGASRHHWGTDLDVYDAAAVAADYRVQLTPGEVADDGVFGPLHRWLDARMAAGRSRGFYRPYGVDRGGVAPERWHLSHAGSARDCESRMGGRLLRDCWRRHLAPDGLLLRGEIEAELEMLVARYVTVPPDWCPAR
ncbi:M15 family metallopeptidase [Parahaliea mediterranea]|uniref:M15 family metallopeptidase n=1 Tax=Parahaliea mediterranea TaxID=651086 RepID=UPI0032193947